MLEGRGAVVTGGGRGIGAAVAGALAEAGARIVVSARSEEQIASVAETLRRAGREAWHVPCDVMQPAQIRQLAVEARAHLGHVDILVNSAGVATSAPLHAITLEEWNRVMAINATGPFLCTQEFLPEMITAGWGRIVSIASIAGKVGHPYIAAYCASKHALVGFTRAVACEVAAKGVTVNAVCPGYAATEMTEDAVRRIAEKTGMELAAARSRLAGVSPQRRLIEVEEVAHLVVSLCDSRARGVNGQAIVLDGGAVQS